MGTTCSDALLGQEGLTLLLNTQMTAATVENGRIERVTLRGLRTESEREAQAQVFVDCTGDGYLSKLAGVPFRTGREGREEFGESLALSAPDGFTQGCSILLQSRRLDHPAPYTAPDYAYPLERIRQLVDRGGRVVRADMQGSDCWWFEYGGKLDVIAEDQRIGLSCARSPWASGTTSKTAAATTRRICSWNGWASIPDGAARAGLWARRR